MLIFIFPAESAEADLLCSWHLFGSSRTVQSRVRPRISHCTRVHTAERLHGGNFTNIWEYLQFDRMSFYNVMLNLNQLMIKQQQVVELLKTEQDLKGKINTTLRTLIWQQTALCYVKI